MHKYISFLTAFGFIILISACASNKSNIAPQSELSQKVISKLEKTIVLTSEQKDKIAEITLASGLTIESEKNDQKKDKYKALMQQIKKEVITPEQRTQLKKSKGS